MAKEALPLLSEALIRGVASRVCHVLLAETVSHYDDELRD